MATSTEFREEIKVFTLDAGQHSLGWLYIVIIYVLGNSQNTYRAGIIATDLQHDYQSEEYNESMEDMQTSSWRKITLSEHHSTRGGRDGSMGKAFPMCGGRPSLNISDRPTRRKRELWIYILLGLWIQLSMVEVHAGGPCWISLYFACWICLHGAKRNMEHYICRRIEELRLEIYRDFIDLTSRRCMFDPILRKSW